jgi:hypothetical protein
VTAILEADFKVSAKFEMKKGPEEEGGRRRGESSNSHLSQDFDDKSRGCHLVRTQRVSIKFSNASKTMVAAHQGRYSAASMA